MPQPGYGPVGDGDLVSVPKCVSRGTFASFGLGGLIPRFGLEVYRFRSQDLDAQSKCLRRVG